MTSRVQREAAAIRIRTPTQTMGKRPGNRRARGVSGGGRPLDRNPWVYGSSQYGPQDTRTDDGPRTAWKQPRARTSSPAYWPKSKSRWYNNAWNGSPRGNGSRNANWTTDTQGDWIPRMTAGGHGSVRPDHVCSKGAMTRRTSPSRSPDHSGSREDTSDQESNSERDRDSGPSRRPQDLSVAQRPTGQRTTPQVVTPPGG